MKSIFIKIAGIFLILLGIIGLFLPFLQGFLFIFLGLSLLSPKLAARFRRDVFLRFSMPVSVPLSEWKAFGVSAGFTTRKFPVHLASTDDLDGSDARSAIRRLWPAKNQPDCFAYLRQVHGNRCVPAELTDFKKASFYRVLDADALVTVERGTALLVLSADCLPIFYAVVREGKAVAVALAHAGWKGTQKKIAIQTLESLLRRSNAHFSEVRVIFGPAIDGPHYEVGDEFPRHFPDSVATSLWRRDGKWHFDVKRENARQLLEAGLSPNQIIDTKLSTVAQNRLFYSFRLEKAAAGRIVSFISLN